MDAGAVEIDELSKRRDGFLDRAGDKSSEQHQASDNEQGQREQRNQRNHDRIHNRTRGRGANFIRRSQYETGITRSISETSFASEPTITRGFRRSIPLTIISPASAGGILSSLFIRARAA